ncbi:MAG: adenosyl-hopene transferase HpnH, partial [Pseudomonadota bacterium]
MAVPVIQQVRVAAYIMKQRFRGNARYPLVLMLEPLFRCNLACPGCGKIDYPTPILNRRLSLEDCIQSVEECGAPIVSIPGGEPLIHKEMPQIVAELVKRKRFVYLCTNAMLLEKKIDEYKPTPYLTFSVHLDGLEEEHDRAVNQKGVFKKAVNAIKLARDKGFRVNINCTLFDNA